MTTNFDSVTGFARDMAQHEIDRAVEMLVGAHAKLGALNVIDRLLQADIVTRGEADLLALYQLPSKRTGGEQIQNITAGAAASLPASSTDDGGDDPDPDFWLSAFVDDEPDDEPDDDDGEHRCPWPGCGVKISPKSVGCRKHWRKIRAGQ